MKKILLICSVTLFVNFSFGQTNIFPPDGNVDIQSGAVRLYNGDGTTGTIEFKRTSDNWNAATIEQRYAGSYGGDLYFKLHPNDGNKLTLPETKVVFKSNGNVDIQSGALRLYNGDGSTGTIEFKRTSDNWNAATIEQRYAGNYGGDLYFKLHPNDGNMLTLPETKVVFKSNGKVGIGIIDPYYQLDVNGTIRAKEVKVNLNIGGADFVFDDDYKLMDIRSLEQYITKNSHLPDIAPASQMELEGINISEINIKLLQKIEELTLYTIAQQKEIEELKKYNTEIEKIKKELELLKALQ